MNRVRIVLLGMLLMLSSCSTIEAIFGPSDEELAAKEQLQQENKSLESEISGLRSSLLELKEDLAKRQVEMAEQQNAPVQYEDRLWVTVSFRSGYMELTKQSRQALERLAAKFNAKERTQTIEVRGFTDDEPIGGYDGRRHKSRHPYKTNEELSQARAENVVQALVDAGISSDAVRAVGYGAVNFVADNATAEGRAKNRRAEIHLIK